MKKVFKAKMAKIRLIMFRVNNTNFAIWPMRVIWIVIQVKKYSNIKKNGLSSSMNKCKVISPITLVNDQSQSQMVANNKLPTEFHLHKLFIKIWTPAIIVYLKFLKVRWSMLCKIWILHLRVMMRKLTFIINKAENIPKTAWATPPLKYNLKKIINKHLMKEWTMTRIKLKMKLKMTLDPETF